MRYAYTLLEVLISTALMTVLFAFIGFAIHTHFRVLDTSRMQVSEAQLARALLEKIARDLRNVVVPIQEETLEVDTEATMSLFFPSGGSDALGMLGVDTSSLMSEDAVSGSSETTENTAPEEGTVAGTATGIYGSLEWLQIDTARLPRGELFGAKITRSGTSPIADRLSPSKTVLYYLGEDTGLAGERTGKSLDQTLGSLGRSLDRNAPKYGLFRREMDRRATCYMMDQGLETEQEQYDEPLAPEVEGIEFLFLDPYTENSRKEGVGDWVEEWDMDELMMLPQAVRITIWIRREGKPSVIGSVFGGNDSLELIAYSTIVVLPVAYEALEETTQEESETEAGGTGGMP